MAMKIRLARGGSKKRPFYRIVAADSRMPRDGRFIEKLGTYNPLLPKDSEERVTMNMDRINYWLGEGAQPTDRISRMLEAAGAIEKKDRNNPKKAEPGQKAKDRAQEKADKLAAAEEAPAAAAGSPSSRSSCRGSPSSRSSCRGSPSSRSSCSRGSPSRRSSCRGSPSSRSSCSRGSPSSRSSCRGSPSSRSSCRGSPSSRSSCRGSPSSRSSCRGSPSSRS